MKMKTVMIVVVIAVVHCAIISALVLTPGCGTPTVVARPSTGAIMPPVEPAPTPTIIRPPVRRPLIVDTDSDVTAYTVRRGDVLSRIARRHGVSVKEIVRLNGLKNPNSLRVNQTILIPVRGSAPAPKPVSKPAPKPAPAVPVDVAPREGMEIYTVRSGDSLSVIAVRCGTSVKALRSENKLVGDRIYIGQELLVPESVGSFEPALEMEEPPAAEPVPEPLASVPDAEVKKSVEESPWDDDADSFVPHDVQFGETLDDIAGMYTISANRLMEFNNLKSEDIEPGMRLRIPQSE